MARTQGEQVRALKATVHTLCKHHLLTPSELERVRAAEARANFHKCIDGRYPALCKHHLLTPSELEQVRAAEARTRAYPTRY